MYIWWLNPVKNPHDPLNDIPNDISLFLGGAISIWALSFAMSSSQASAQGAAL